MLRIENEGNIHKLNPVTRSKLRSNTTRVKAYPPSRISSFYILKPLGLVRLNPLEFARCLRTRQHSRNRLIRLQQPNYSSSFFNR